jgi:hypothetical protein
VQQGSYLTNTATAVSNGLFTVTLDFGAALFAGADCWLDLAVRTNGSGAFTALIPRQMLTSVPYSITAGKLAGALPSTQLAGGYGNAVTFSNAANRFNGTFNGDGGNATNVNAAMLSGLNASDFWKTGGNGGTSPDTHFLGTTDAQELQFRVGNTAGLRLLPGAGHPNVIGGGPSNSINSSCWSSFIGGGTSNEITSLIYNAGILTGSGNLIDRLASWYPDHSVIGGGINNTNAGFAAVVPGGKQNLAYGQFSLAAGHRAKAVGDGSFVWADYQSADFASTTNNQFLIRASGGVGIGTNTPRSALHVHGTIMASNFIGSGAGLTNISVASLTGGAVADALLSNNIPRLNNNNVFTGLSTFSPTAGAPFAVGSSNKVTGLNADLLDGLDGNSYWRTTGNTGATAGLHFLGTSDNQPLDLRAAGQTVLRLEGDARGGTRIIGGPGGAVSSEATNSSVLGGLRNTIAASAHHSTIAGGQDNAIRLTQMSAFIGGGARNEVGMDNQHAVIVGGRDNGIGTNCVITSILGGAQNLVGDNVDGGLMVGGFRNSILGSPDSARREIAPALLGGSDNTIGLHSWFTVILGGDNNRIGTNSPTSTIAGGTNNIIADNAGHSFAAGRRARVNHPGTFVWADSQNADFASQDTNSFNLRANGGVWLNEDTSLFFGNGIRQMINLYGANFGIGVQSFTHYSRTDASGSFSWFRGGAHTNTQNNPGTGGTEMMRLTSGGLQVNGTFVSASDRNLKEKIKAVDCRDVLEKVADLPVSAWSYKAAPSIQHLGPMAQDFKAAFGLGDADTGIATVDADGVALAAIQGLNQKVEEKEARIRELETRNREQEARLQKLEALIGLRKGGTQ